MNFLSKSINATPSRINWSLLGLLFAIGQTTGQTPSLTPSSGFTTDTSDSSKYTATLPADVSNPSLPGSVILSAEGTSTPIELQIDLLATINYDPATPFYGSLFQFSTELGTPTAIDNRHPLVVNSHGPLTVSNIQAPDDPTVIGNAAIQALGRPNGNSNGIGSDVLVSVANDITVNGVGTGTPGAGDDPITLSPSALRTAQLSGVTAVSWGLQDSGNESDTVTGATVTVNTDESANITVNQSSDSVITAGISASSASGPGTKGYGTDEHGFHKVAVSHSGDITVNATTGVGIFANTTGAQKFDESSSEAFGGEVIVDLRESASIMSSGIGIFALSEVSPVSEKNTDTIQGGHVLVDLGDNTSITAGDDQGGSALAIGVLAVSASSNQLINPFSQSDGAINSKGDGKGGSVEVRNSGTIKSYGDTSAGIAALSIGGASVITSSDPNSNRNSYLGSNGEFKGGGEQVTVNNLSGGVITTQGLAAHGIVALSSASGGLLNNLEEAIRIDPNHPIGLTIGNGPDGPDDDSTIGHDGGSVSVTNAGKITTGDGSNDSQASVGILAQSIGGGGGSAGNKSSLFVGDQGGAGGNGGTVDVTTAASSVLTTNDANSVGILAQSIGGGGGNGGNAEGFFVAVGGSGGSGGDGGQINFSIDGSVSTKSDHSGGLIVQSVGGGGGHGGGATDYTAVVPVGTAVGGSGAKGGAGGQIGDPLNPNDTAAIKAGATITTIGDNSPGATIQSIAGGGGTGGGASSYDVAAGLSIAVAVGGSGGDGNAGGESMLINAGTITTGKEVIEPVFGLIANDGADSIGAIVQSIGGGGGHGGSASALALAFLAPLDEDPASFSVAVGTGGSGGGGGDGGTATFTNDGSITTWGDGAHGALVQSIGGGGGNGGDSKAYSAAIAAGAPSATFSVSHGGSGQAAGAGGSAQGTLDEKSVITTHGQNASGLVVQSIGGGGGNGGVGTASSRTVGSDGDEEDPINIDFTMALGGSGGNGGDGGEASAITRGMINTDGVGSKGIHIKSIGGGGGSAGGGSVGGGGTAYTTTLVIGATGGSGGDADSSSINNYAQIQTEKGDSTAILVQSIGGGGGAGGNAVAQEARVAADSYNYEITIGGQGGAGGKGGTTTVNNFGSLMTQGPRSNGITAQSIGGGGGVGGGGSAYSTANHAKIGSSNVGITVGGQGGGGGDGGAVNVIVSEAPIQTGGYASHGVVAQSVGGGGGIGGEASVDATSTINLGFAVKEGGGAGGQGGQVTVYQNDQVTTTGHQSVGVMAQSVGGGGGIASQGSDIKPFSFDVNLAPSVTFNFGINTDKGASDPSNGGDTTVNLNIANVEFPDISTNNSTTTEGDWSIGVLAQSVGAGGGKGDNITGTNSNSIPTLNIVMGSPQGHGSGGNVNVVAGTTRIGDMGLGTAHVSTGTDSSGYGAYGVLAQSIGGGGGMASDGSSASATGSSIQLGAESKEGSGGTRDGDAVSLTAKALSVETQGTAAHGIILQSIGGGGGVAGTGATRDYSGSLDGVDGPSITLGGAETYGAGQSLTMSEGNGNVTVTTSGDNAFGFVAQSIGSGGGIVTSKQTDGGITLGANLASDDKDPTDRGGGDIGGDTPFTFDEVSRITTHGKGSHGVVLQTIGGGGGIANPNSSGGIEISTTTRDASSHGYGGSINVNLDGHITTSGDGANGVIAQVIGGGGGLFRNFAGSTGGANSSGDGFNNGTIDITVGSKAKISTTGKNTNTIFAQNVTGNGNPGNFIAIEINGSVSSDQGTAIRAHGGADNSTDDAISTLRINQGGEVSSPFDQNAIHLQGANGTEIFQIANAGTITGGVFLDTVASGSGFLNAPTGTFNSGESVNAIMDDQGIFAIGGADHILQTQMEQNYTQNTGATLQFDVTSSTTFDQLVFGSAYGYFEGNIEINLLMQQLQVGDHLTLVTASTGNVGNSFSNNYTTQNATFLNMPDGMLLELFHRNGALFLDVIAVPEPGYAALLAGILAFAYLQINRRRGR
ncbi:hypothetical protein [Rubellicoccus peritrichatus]|uniref:Uncharacterized protein n=1 Tax=Rubellicoccus peritrichatus TaxID=3080537 RepID=A0AAQ3L965_9BACT|nr:hypothetical protein [Puniceicoccus sp. CR14]WOO40239.1 hypothetical protein RZN69_16585 [Puniceicoccus sp. CR14]